MNQQAYQDNGYTIYQNYFPITRINQINKEIDRLEKILPISDEVFDENGTGKIKQIQYLHQKSEICDQLLSDMKSVAIELIGHDKFKVLNMQLFEKHPQISKPTRAHQDNAYFKLTPTKGLFATFTMAGRRTLS